MMVILMVASRGMVVKIVLVSGDDDVSGGIGDNNGS